MAWSSKALRAPDLPAGTAFDGVFLVRKLAERMARNDRPFRIVEVGDREGAFSFNLFADHPAWETLAPGCEGSVVAIEGRADSYQGRFSPKVLEVRKLPEAELTAELMERLVECSPEDPAAMWADIEAFTAAIEPAELSRTVASVWKEFGEAFRTSPAAISMHHAYRSGLLEHTVHMARAAKALLPLYPQVNPGLAIAGILLHDIGKVIEYGAPSGKTRAGILNGHVVLGYRIARKHAKMEKLGDDLLERLEHIILSHQGELEWGAAVLASTPEAVFVSMVDNLDAKMGMVQHALRTAPEGAEFSERLPGLKAQVLLKG